jgi:hypothetical protein
LPRQRLITVPVLALLLVSGLLTTPAASSTPTAPNLIPLKASEIRIQYSGSTKLLRFTTTTWNSGLEPLELIAGSVDSASGKQQVYQRLYDIDGTWTDFLAGFMEWHDSHQHFHFDDYATYVLQPVAAAGASERTGTKLTFCVMDTDRINTKMVGAPKRAVYSSCGVTKQGMSVGWGDSYRYYLNGQFIDITGLPNGDYRLVINVDPKNKLIETNDSDNSSSVNIRISGDSVQVLDGGGSGRPR